MGIEVGNTDQQAFFKHEPEPNPSTVLTAAQGRNNRLPREDGGGTVYISRNFSRFTKKLHQIKAHATYIIDQSITKPNSSPIMRIEQNKFGIQNFNQAYLSHFSSISHEFYIRLISKRRST